MQLHTAHDTAPTINTTYQHIASRLDQQKSVLWLIPGGSVIPAAVEVMKRLQAHPLQKLSITLTDERFGPANHPDENYYQLQQAGFNPGSATWYRPNSHADISQATQDWQAFLQDRLSQSDFSIGLFGIGPDGHTAGLLPGSPALTSDQLTAHFQGYDYPRITTTAPLISQLDLAIAHAFGQSKWPELQKLIEQDLPPSTQPAQALKLAKQSILFSDFNP